MSAGFAQVALLPLEAAEALEQASTERAGLPHHLDGSPMPVASLVVLPAEPPEVAQGPDQLAAGDDVRLALLQGPAQRGAQVVAFGVEQRHGAGQPGALELRARLVRQAGEVRKVAGAVLVTLACIEEPIPSVLADRLQHVVPPGAPIEHDERLGDQPRQQFEHIPGSVGAHGFGGFERPTAGEHR